jgi:hypothetical protein
MRAVGTRFAGQAIVGALALCVSAAFSTAWAAKAGPAVAFTIDQTPAATVSTDSAPSEIGYGIQVSNAGKSTVNSVVLTAPLSVTATGGTAATFVQVIGANATQCTIGATTVSCSFGSFVTGSGAEVTFIYRSPTAGSEVSFSATLTYKEGTTDRSPNSAPNDSQTRTVVTALLAAGDFRQAGTYLRSNGGTVQTGNQAITTETDPWSTRVIVPGTTSAAAIGVELFEDEQAESCAFAFTCGRSAVRAPGSYPAGASTDRAQAAASLLKLYYRLDAKTAKGNASAIGLYYEPGVLKNGVFTPTGAKFVLLECSDDTFAANNYLPYAGAVGEQYKRCINSRTTLSGSDVDFKDVVIEVYLTENGRVSLL